ncbi:MAG: hypothetical protein B9S32_03855 [Verrucomicrobia bacterium Tous-C9LFEB]|nr:MAG: hypothetical protein B9S32_03855 [Verrucomicrobia bacterium Tous-C9LFEB]
MSTLHILHLEDDATDAFFIRQTLEQNGIQAEVERTSNPDDFLSRAKRDFHDVFLLDHGVPQGNSSRGTLTQLRDARPRTPVILISHTDNEKEIEESLNAGADDFISKRQLWQLPRVIHRLREATQREAAASELEKHARGMMQLVEVVQQLSHVRTMAQVMEIVRHAARRLTGADGATFVLLEGDLCYYADEDAIQPLWKGQRFPTSNCIIGHVAVARKPILIEDIYKDPRVPIEFYKPTFVKSMAVVPIRSDSPIGGIGNYWAKQHRPTEHEIELLQALANTTSLAIENVQLYASLEERVKDRTLQLQAANRELEAFSSSVSHDLRAPLCSIGGYAQLLGMELPAQSNPTAHEHLASIQSEVQRMGGLIEDLLRLAKFTRIELNRRPVDLAELAHELVSRLKGRWPDHLVMFRCPDHLPAQGDTNLLRVVLENLLSNAWKYSSKKSKAVVELGVLDCPGQAPIYFVRDNGAGFDMRHAQNLFAPFQRLHTSEEFPGTGIGLATIHRIIQRHGGKIWAEAEPGQGATFFFTLSPHPEVAGD